MTTTAELRTLIFLYARISEDPRDLRQGVTRQMEDLVRFALEELGGEIAGKYVENDVSAHADGVERPQYDLLMAAAMAAAARPGVRVIIAAYHPSRLWRRRVERAQAIEDLRRAKIFVAFESGGFFNLQKATERSQLAQLGENDTAESEVKSERVARAALARAREGRSNGAVAFGWRRQYTYDRQGRIIGFTDIEHEEQGPIVREIVARILGGDPVITITADLNARGIPSPGAGHVRKHRTQKQNEDGTLWNKSSVRKIAVRDANIALRRHGEDTYPAQWPALVSESDHARVKALFAARTIGSRRVAPGQRKHMLTHGDIATCGVCGSWLKTGMRGNNKRGYKQSLYLCDNGEHVGRNEAAVDNYVRDLIRDRMSRPDALILLDAPDDGAMPQVLNEIAGLRAKEIQDADDYEEGLLTREQFHRMNATRAVKLADAQARLRQLQPTVNVAVVEDLADPDPDVVAARWDGLDVVRRRQVLEALGLRLQIQRTTRGRGFDPNSITHPNDQPFGHRQ